MLSREGRKADHPHNQPGFTTSFAGIIKEMPHLLSQPIVCYRVFLLETGNKYQFLSKRLETGVMWLREAANVHKFRPVAKMLSCDCRRDGHWNQVERTLEGEGRVVTLNV